jgi:hypothetical protein
MGAQGAQALPHLEPLRIQALQHVCQRADVDFEDANISPESRTSTLRGHPQSKHASRCLVSYVSIVYIVDESKRSTLTHHACVLIWGTLIDVVAISTSPNLSGSSKDIPASS